MSFVRIGDNLINMRYIKIISPDVVVIANTKSISAPPSRDPQYRPPPVEAKDQRFPITKQQYDELLQQLRDKKRINVLEEELNQLRLHVSLLPGGDLYEKALKRFESYNKN